MNISTLDDLHIDAMTGSRFMGMLGISNVDLRDPSRFSKFQQILDFFTQLPEDTQNFLIRNVTKNPHVDRLQKTFEYMQLLDRKQSLDRDMESVRKESSILPEEADPSLRSANTQKQMFIADSLKTVARDIEIYEK